MPAISEGHRYILTLTERLTSYVCAIPLKALSVRHVCSAMEIFLSICPPMEEVHTDHGSSDFGGGFTELLESFGIRHEGALPNRSQAQGSVESSNRLIQNQLNKICAENGSSKQWHKSLPKVIQAINSFHPYKSPFSRKQLLYSPYYFCPLGGPINLKNPIRGQKCLYKYLNEKRIEALLGARGSNKKKIWMVGQFVTLEQENYTGSLIDKLSSPRNANIYKIISINKQGFSCSVMNVLSGAVYEVLQSRLRQATG